MAQKNVNKKSEPAVAEEKIYQASAAILSGGLVAFPTETYYGLAVDPFNEQALERLFRAKGRPELKPVLLLVSDPEQLTTITTVIPDNAWKLMDRFWPGPLTLVLPARPELSGYITGNTGTVGVRLSPHPIAAALLKTCNTPITATSANRSGDPPAVTAGEVRQVLDSHLDYVLDGGRTPGQQGSTLVGFEDEKIVCIRQGCVPFQDILAVLDRG